MNTDKKGKTPAEKKVTTPKNKGISAATLDSITKPATSAAKAKAGRGLTNEGTNVVYNEER
ncbi:hypothetical protein BH11BAC3_BH11BAC3_23380 [soil metagenome]